MQTSRQPRNVTPTEGDVPCYSLPARWSPKAQSELEAFLRANSTRPVQISAAGLKRVDCLMLQYLAAAARAWAAGAQEFALIEVPKQVDEVFGLLGVTSDMLTGKVSG